jgi:hypothetical protein
MQSKALRNRSGAHVSNQSRGGLGWKGGKVEGWKGGRMEGWKGGRVEEWLVKTMRYDL